MNLSKKQIYITAFILIVATTAGLFGIFNFEMNKNLKTYTNDEYGISFQYPENWRIMDGEDQVSEPYIALVVKGDTNPRSRMLVSVGTQNRIRTQEELYQSDEIDRYKTTTDLTIDNKQATLIKDSRESGIGYVKMFIFSDYSTYTITLTNENDYFEDFREVFKTIYKSFKIDHSYTLKTYTNDEYGISFQYPENVTVYEKGDKEFYPPSEDKIIAWGETDETFPNPVRGNSTVPYRISILEGRHPFETKNYERITTFKEKDGEIFTIRYGGPATAITTDPIPAIKNAYEIISESFEIN